MLKQRGLLLNLCLLCVFLGCETSQKPPKTGARSERKVHLVSRPVIPSPNVGEATWPQWRGPHQDGISREENWKQDWSQSPPIAWTTHVGIGYSSVSVADGQLYTMGHPAGSEQETVWCLDPETGRKIWSVTYPCALLDHLHKGGPGATPTIDGEFVYVNSREGEIRKLKAQSGEVVWLFDLREALEIDLPEWGFTCSPVLFGEEIIVEAGSVLGINKETGKMVWRTEPHQPGYGTPELFEFQGKPYLAALNNEGLSVIDLTTKQEVTLYAWDSPYKTNATTPLWQDGQLFISTGYNIGCAVINFDGTSLSPEWQNKNMRNHMNSCILRDGYLYGVDGNSHIPRTVTFNCIDWESGELRWRKRGLGCGAVSATRDHLLILSDDGELVLAQTSPEEFLEKGRVRVMDEQCWTVPVLCNGLIYCRGAEGTLACVNVRENP